MITSFSCRYRLFWRVSIIPNGEWGVPGIHVIGSVTDHVPQVVVDKDTSRKRGFGFVSFATYQTVDNILAKKEHSIMDKVVEVNHSVSSSRRKLVEWYLNLICTQVKKAFPKGTGAVPVMNRGPPIMPNRGGPYPGPRGYGGGGQGYYGGHEGGYNQQVDAILQRACGGRG
jgi:hypothetical protein